MVRHFKTTSLLLMGVMAVTSWMGAAPAAAQNEATASLFSLDSSQFPEISAYLEVRGPQGQFLRDLTTQDLTIIEDGKTLPVQELELLETGAQYVVAVNPGQPFAIRDGNGSSRYDRIVSSLLSWALAHQDPGEDDLSLLIAGGPQLIHTEEASGWAQAFESYQEDLKKVEPGLDVLALAVDVVSDQTAREGMGRGILFISPPLEEEYTIGLQTLAARARQQGVRISVWFVSAPDYYSTEGPGLLGELADQTGGSLFPFSGPESLPGLQSYLEPLRTIYRLVYTSAIASTGEHQAAVQVRYGGKTFLSSNQVFPFDIVHPNPIFVSPPTHIFRTGPRPGLDGIVNLDPDQHVFEVLVEYPDGYPRQLTAVLLYIDGVLTVQKSEPPFDMLIWDLQPYMESKTHMLKVQVVDSLGLIGETSELPVRLDVEIPRETILIRIARLGPVFAGIAVGLSAAILLLVLVLGGRIRPGLLGRALFAGGSKIKKVKAPRTFSKEPLTQPVRGITQPAAVSAESDDAARRGGWRNRLHWPQRQVSSKAYAFLTRLSEDAAEGQSAPFAITTEDVRIGRDAFKATLVLEDTSLDGLHALLTQENGTYRLSDAGSIAGTWVNYSPVSAGGTLLEHGDIIHVGRVGFRFNLREPAKPRRLAVKWKEPSA